MELVNSVYSQAFHHHNDHQLKSAHLLLNNMYYSVMYNEDEAFMLDEKMQKRMAILEDEWMRYEKSECLSRYNFTQEVNEVALVEAALKRHNVYHHHLFDYLALEANEHEFKQFILNESVLNIDFFDYLALALIGVSDQTRAEIMANLWDEAGQGNIQRFHTVLFRKLLRDLDLTYRRDMVIANMSWQGLAGINLFSYLARYPFNKIKYFGLLAATEMLDPDHYIKFMQGMNRVFKDKKIDCTYYLEHQTIDIQHANGWLKNVVIPELAKNPNKIADFWLGFYMRLDSVHRYYDYLLNYFLTRQAA